jgi:hypothetical protein
MAAVLIFEQITLTRFMQAADLFEPFKFIGNIVRQEFRAGTSAVSILDQLDGLGTNVRLAGVIFPGREAAFLGSHIICSNGNEWWMMDEWARSTGAEQITWFGRPMLNRAGTILERIAQHEPVVGSKRSVLKSESL